MRVNPKKISLCLSILLILSVLAGCSQNKNDIVKELEKQELSQNTENYPMEVEDDFGNKVTIEKAPEKIISLAPSHTEILFSLGLDAKIAGVTTYCDYPEEAKTKEIIGDYTAINLEKIIEIDPDLVLIYGPGDEESNNRLKEAGITILGFMPESIDQVIDTIKKIGEITEKTEEAKEITDKMIEKRDSIAEKVKDKDKVKVFYEIWHDPLMAAGPGSFMDELMTIAGGDNIAKDAEGQYPQFDIEQLIERNPEVYLTSKDSEEKTVESIKARPGYEDITAIKEGNIYILDPNIVSRPGPRIVEALELVAKAIHPELFK
ncbi:cobalamin-binding protein [Tissierella sp. MSJ-40]|uniref:Cobalamin-binding protein n=1 Tax=Tissierella simiarum TaxID=2841534 RepID=A0ABS6E4L3_9FIRM|nr:cobalamin-binding protein [Tissierella simiarum]MBU5437855.1 cobalamin-binding protein [Tissierella simiarum]